MRIPDSKKYQMEKMIRNNIPYRQIASTLHTSFSTIRKLRNEIFPDGKNVVRSNVAKKSVSKKSVSKNLVQKKIYTYADIHEAMAIWSWINKKRLISKEKRNFLRDFIMRCNEA